MNDNDSVIKKASRPYVFIFVWWNDFNSFHYQI